MKSIENESQSPKSRRIAFAIALVIIPAALLWILFAPQPQGEPTFEMTQDNFARAPQHSRIEQMEQMWKAAPGHGPVALELANLYFEDGRYEKAIAFYRIYIKQDTTSEGWLVRLDISRALSALNRTDEAIAELKKMLGEHPGHPGALYNLGAIEANRGDHESARKHWNELIASHPQDTLAAYAKASLPKLKP